MQLPQAPRASRATRAGERRRHLIDVTRELFVAKGFHATGVAQIAAASGIKVGQIYRDFGCKEDVIAALVAEDLATFLDEDGLRRAVEAGDRAGVRTWLDRFFTVEKPVGQCCMMAEIHAEAARNDRIADIHDVVNRRVHSQIMTALCALIPGDEMVLRRRDVGDLIMTLGMGLTTQRVVNRTLDASRLAGIIVRLIDAELDDAAEAAAHSLSSRSLASPDRVPAAIPA